MENALVPYGEMSLPETLQLGETLAKSGYFSDAKAAAQAVVKVMAGRELGIGPIASMAGIGVIKGKVVIGANLLAAAVKRDPRYDYRVLELSAERCEVAFYEKGKELGRSVFTAQDAQKAEIGRMVAPGAQGNMMQRFPRNMLFARAVSNGIKWYCPDVTGGAPVYTPDELSADVDEEGNMIDVTPTVTETRTETRTSEQVGDKPPVSSHPRPTGDNGGNGDGAWQGPLPDIGDTPADYTEAYKRVEAGQFPHIENRHKAANVIKKVYAHGMPAVADGWDELIEYENVKQAEEEAE